MKGQKVQFNFIAGKLSATLIIPIELARKHGLKSTSNVIVEDTDNGILIKSNKV